MSLFRASDPDKQHDVLASNLLFITLFLHVGEQLFLAVVRFIYLSHEPDPLWPGAGIWLLVEVLLKACFYYAIRRGMFRAKVVVALACAFLAYMGTHWREGYVAGVAFYNLWGWPLLTLLQDLLTLAALVLMFTKPRVGAT